MRMILLREWKILNLFFAFWPIYKSCFAWC